VIFDSSVVGLSFMDCNQPAPAVECFRMALELEPNHLETQTLFMKAMSQHSKDFLASSKTPNPQESYDVGEPFVDPAGQGQDGDERNAVYV
jgi:hypothetical protein